MFDTGTKFKYFKLILNEVYKIIEINFEIKDDDLPKLLGIIDAHLESYNGKNGGIVTMGSLYNKESGELSVFLSDYVRGRGKKKIFEDKISIKTIHRDKLLDKILGYEDI